MTSSQSSKPRFTAVKFTCQDHEGEKMENFNFFRKKNPKGLKTALSNEWVDIEPEIVTMHAKVADMCCFTESKGTKMPILIRNFFVLFEDDNGQMHKIAVDEELYTAFEIGQVGELTLVDGGVTSYILDGDTD
ncbi:MAG: hypothetical protein IKB75_06040 [Clostridia bacterium]|nr:hypothetical protein [Clostridia bacterium]